MKLTLLGWQKLLVVLFMSGSLASLGASNAHASAGIRFGVLDMQRVILNVEEGKTARNQLEKEIKAKEAEFLKQKQELDKLNDDWKNQAALLSDEARMRKQKEFQEKFMELRNAEMGFQNEIKKKEAEATQKIAMKAAQIAEGMAKQKSLQAVFETSSAGLIYVESPVDLTQEVISSYNKGSNDPKKVSKR